MQDLSKNTTDDDNNKIHKSNEEPAWKLIDNHEDLSLVKTSSKKEVVHDNKKHSDYKSIPPPYHIKAEISTDETSSEASSTSPKSNESSVQAYKPKAKSVRRRRNKSISGHNDIDGTKGNVVRKTNSSVGKQEQKQGLEMLTSNVHDDQWDEQEKDREMDRLLEYYSTKKPPPLQQDGEPTSSIEATKQADHDTEFQHGALKTSMHVHPKLPDYDDLAARFAALKGK